MKFPHSHLSALCLLVASAVIGVAAEPLQFIPATPANTTLIDGSPVGGNQGEASWKWLPEEGNQGVFESRDDPKRDEPVLIITASGLEPGRDYEVFGFFWTHGFGPAPAARAKQPHHWPARFGLGLATLTTYGGRQADAVPWILCPESKIASRFGYTVAVEEKDPLVQGVSNWIAAVDDTRMIRARLGISRADLQGVLPVYADDFPNSKFCGKTRIDGIGLRLLPVGDHDGVGAGKPGHLHLAVRAGDLLNMRRELAAGADVNALDEDGVTPLLYTATSGDIDIVRELLKAGANPNRPEQLILPLTGAASWGDVAMVKLLMEAGAEVPAKLPARSPLLEETLDPARLHPAVAAIRAGSLGCLKLILAKQPDLDLMSLTPDMEKKKRLQNWKSPADMVVDAVRRMHDELATFLVERGCKVSEPTIIADCVGFGEGMAKTREALLRRGIPAIQPIPYNPYAGEYANEIFVKPWDALSAAVFMGDLDLTKRFLPLAKDLDERYLLSLYALADACGKLEILAALQQGGLARPVVEANLPSAEQSDQDEKAVRLFLPRLGARAEAKAPAEGKWNLAVIPAPEAAGAAALVEARASNSPRWQVVDRSLIEAALLEDRNAKPWEKGEHQLSGLGDRLSADILLIVTKLAGGNIQLIRFEAVDVVSGLVIHREYAEEKSLAAEKTLEPLLGGIEAALGRARTSKRPMAVSLLTFTAEKNLPSPGSLAGQFKAAMEIAVDATPGMLSVGMNEINAIAREQTLRGEGSFWAAACTVEGGIAPLPGGRVALSLRLRNLTGQAERPVDATVEGTSEEIPALAGRAWRKLQETGGIPAVAAGQVAPDPARAALEAVRLAREAEWLLSCQRPREARPLAERAALLGASPETVVPLILKCLLHEIPLGAHYGFSSSETLLPPALPYQQALIDRLDAICELAERTETLFRQHGHHTHQWKREPMLFVEFIRKLCYIRSIMPPHLLTREQMEKFDSFGAGLDRLVPDCFGQLAKAFQTYKHLSAQDHIYSVDTSASSRMLKRNPKLAEEFCRITLARRRDNITYDLDQMLYRFIDRSTRQSPDALEATEIMVSEITNKMESFPAEQRRKLESMFALIKSRGDATPILLRQQQLTALDVGRLTPLWRAYGAVSSMQDKHYGLREFFQMEKDGLPTRRNFVLHSIFHQPVECPDGIVRHGYLPVWTYDWQAAFSNIQESGNARSDMNSLRQQTIARAPDKLRHAMVDEMSNQRINGRIEALALFDLLFGIEMQDPIKKEWMKITEKATPKASMSPRMLTDLRRGPEPTLGIFDHYLPDSSTPGRLWLRYRPQEGGLCRTDGGMLIRDNTKELGTWLFGIHCGTGAVDPSTSLHTFVELRGDDRQDTMWQDYQNTFIAQNSSALLTQVGWRDPGDPESWRAAYALIDKTTGKAGPLIKGIAIKAFSNYPRHQAAFVEVIQDEFFLIAHREEFRNPNARQELIRLDKTGNLVSLTKIGRRPELSPFDAEDRTPVGMVEDQGSLLVYDYNKRHMARYQPKEEAWTAIESDDRARSGVLINATQKTFADRTNPTRMVKMLDGKGMVEIKGDPGIWPDGKVYFPSLLAVTMPGKKNLEVPLHFDFPGGYAEKARFMDGALVSGNKQIPERYFTVSQLQDQKRLHVVVLHQTELDLILGLRVKPLMNSSFGASEAFLPFLWALPKSELFGYLQK